MDTDKIYRSKDRYEAKYQFSIKKSEDVWTKHFNDSKAFTEYSNNKDDIYKNIEEQSPNKKTWNFNGFWWYDCWYA